MLGVMALALVACRSAESLRPPIAGSSPAAPAHGPVSEPSEIVPASFQEAPEPPELVPGTRLQLAPEDPSDPTSRKWSLAELEDLAVAQHPGLAEAVARVEAIEGRWYQAGLLPNPSAGYVADEMGDAGSAGRQGAFVSQQVVLPAKRRLDRTVAAAELQAAQQQLAAEQQRVLTDVRTAFYEALIAQQRVAVASEIVHVSQQVVDVSRQLFEAREISRVSLIQAESRAAEERLLVREAEIASDAANRRLRYLCGLDQATPLVLEGDVTQLPEMLEWETIRQRIMEQSPELAAALFEIEQAQWRHERALIEPLPDPEVTVAVTHDNVSGDTFTSVEVGVPLPLFDRNQGNIQSTEAELSRAHWAYERLKSSLQSELVTTYRTYRTARLRVDAYRGDILKKTKEALKLVEQGYRQGELDYLTLLTSERDYDAALLAYLDAVESLWKAHQEMEGLLLKDSLSRDE